MDIQAHIAKQTYVQSVTLVAPGTYKIEQIGMEGYYYSGTLQIEGTAITGVTSHKYVLQGETYTPAQLKENDFLCLDYGPIELNSYQGHLFFDLIFG